MSGRTRDCVCPRAVHVHGTEQAYISDRCRCPGCQAAHAERAAWRRRMRAYKRDIAHLVPAVGSARRLEALAWAGWSATVLAADLGCDPVMLHRVRKQPRILASKAAAISDVYERLWDQPPPASTRGQRISIGRTKQQAYRLGFAPPLAWDDIDDPNETPDLGVDGRGVVDEIAVEEAMRGRRVELTGPERREAIARLTAAGKSASVIASLLGTTGRTVTRRRSAVERAA